MHQLAVWLLHGWPGGHALLLVGACRAVKLQNCRKAVLLKDRNEGKGCEAMHAHVSQELQEWRVRLNGQVTSYQEEIGGLRAKLVGEMEALKADFVELRGSLQQQMEATWAATGRGGEAPGRGGEAPGRGGDALGSASEAPGRGGEAPGSAGEEGGPAQPAQAAAAAEPGMQEVHAQ